MFGAPDASWATLAAACAAGATSGTSPRDKARAQAPNAASTAAQGYFVFRHPRTTCNTASIVNVLQTATVLRAWCLAMTVAVLTCGVDRDTDSPVKATLTWVWLAGAGAVVAGGAVSFAAPSIRGYIYPRMISDSDASYLTI